MEIEEPKEVSKIPELLKLEHQLVKVPFESLKKSIRAGNRAFEKDVNAVVSTVADVGKKDVPKEEVCQHLNSCITRLHGLKRKLGEIYKNEEIEIQKSVARLNHLKVLEDKGSEMEWKKSKFDRLLVDYMLRSSYTETAAKLAEASSIQDLVDTNLFNDAKRVVDALKSKDCTVALAWCSENKGKLKKTESTFEFKLRIQEFIELVRIGKLLDALAYARKFLAPFAANHMQELQQAMLTLAMSKRSFECETYKAMFDQNRWDNLIHLFKTEMCKMHGITVESLLQIYLQAGLSALKTPFCYEEGCTKEDPLSNEIFRNFAETLPFSKNIRSKLICHITKEPMDEDNPPLVLPNGYAYSSKALEEMSKINNGKITCPKTGEIFKIEQATRAFVS